MKKLRPIHLLLIILFSYGGIHAQEKTDDVKEFKFEVEAAPEWTDLFYRKSGWFGADGIFSFTLNGMESTGAGIGQKTLLTFSDTYIGEVSGDKPLPGNVMVNNTVAYVSDISPGKENISFHYKQDEDGKPVSYFVPTNEKATPEQYYWLGDGFINQEDNGNLYLFAYHVHKTGPNVFDFALTDVSLLVISNPGSPGFEEHKQLITPLHVSNERFGEADFGGGIFVNTEWAGAPNPDGYVYVYGCFGPAKELVVARSKPSSFTDFDTWTYWNGSEWQSDINQLAVLADNVSNELSVTPMKDGRYILVHQVMGLSDKVGVRIGESPWGPFGPTIEIWTTPEYNQPPGILPYNAKAHPTLSKPGELLISYNTITFNFWEDIQENAHIYRPRFIVLKSESLR